MPTPSEAQLQFVNQLLAGIGRNASQSDLDKYGGLLAGGSTEQQVRNTLLASPEGQVYQNFQQLLGRNPDPNAYEHHVALLNSQGPAASRREMQMQPEYVNRMLGGAPTGPMAQWQQAARMATQGINSMPHTFSDYGNPLLGNPQQANQIFYPPKLQQGYVDPNQPQTPAPQQQQPTPVYNPNQLNR